MWSRVASTGPVQAEGHFRSSRKSVTYSEHSLLSCTKSDSTCTFPDMTHTGTLLVVDDNSDVLTAARLALAPHFEKVVTLQTPDHLVRTLAGFVPDAILLDMNFAPGERTGREGLDWLGRLRVAAPTASVVLMTAFGGVSLAVEALKNGAVDIDLTPWQNDKLVATKSAAVALPKARALTDILISESTPPKVELIGCAVALRQVFDIII